VLLGGDDVCPEKRRHPGEWLSTLVFIHSETSGAVREFQALQKEYPNCLEHSWLEGGAKSALEKCKRNYDLVDSSAAYYVAEALQPTRKWGWLHEQWYGDLRKRRRLDNTKRPFKNSGKMTIKIGLMCSCTAANNLTGTSAAQTAVQCPAWPAFTT
jgi:hypothetical protein